MSCVIPLTIEDVVDILQDSARGEAFVLTFVLHINEHKTTINTKDE